MPTIQNIMLDTKPEEKLLRLRLEIVSQERKDPVDLTLHYAKPKIYFPVVSLPIEGQELLRRLCFNLELSFNLLKSRFNVKGTIGNKKLDRPLDNISEVLVILKSVM
jgi:hypothetical protein